METIEILERLIALLEQGEVTGDETLLSTYYHTIYLGDMIDAVEEVILNKKEPENWGY